MNTPENVGGYPGCRICALLLVVRARATLEMPCGYQDWHAPTAEPRVTPSFDASFFAVVAVEMMTVEIFAILVCFRQLN